MALESIHWGGRWRAFIPLILPSMAILAVLNVYALWFVGAEATLYHADQVTYWSYSQQLAHVLEADPAAALRAVAHTVANNDVNLLPAVPVAFVMTIFGDSRLVYILAVINVYGAAAVLMLVMTLRRLGIRHAAWVGPLSLLLVATPWRAILIGYLDIGGVALALAVLALALPGERRDKVLGRMAAAGVVLALLVLFRRWWGIWAVALFLALAAIAVTDTLRLRRPRRRFFPEAVLGPLTLAGTTVVTLLVLAAPIVVERLRTDYADRFAAYGGASIRERAVALIGHYGVVGIALVTAGAVLLLYRPSTRRTAALLTLHLVITYTIMVNIQDHSPQHWYLYDPQVLLIVGLAIDQLSKSLSRWRLVTLAAALAILGAFSTASVYLPSFELRPRWSVLPTDRVRPRVRHDLGEIERLLTYLDHRCAASAGPIYVLASSEVLSDQVLGFSNLSLNTNHPSVGEILGAAHVDRRDGFPRGLLVAQTVLVAEPVQVHLRPEDQRVVVEPANSFLQSTDVALAFRRLAPVFELDGGIRVIVFERWRAHAPEEVDGLSARLRRAYPDRPEIFAP